MNCSGIFYYYIFLFLFSQVRHQTTKSPIQHFIAPCNYSSDNENDGYLIKICGNCKLGEMWMISPNCNFLLSSATFFEHIWELPSLLHTYSPPSFLPQQHFLLPAIMRLLYRSRLISTDNWWNTEKILLQDERVEGLGEFLCLMCPKKYWFGVTCISLFY